MKHRIISFILLFLSPAAFSAAVESQQFHFVPAEGNFPVIVVSKNATASERFAAEELASHLKQVTKHEFSIVDDSETPQGSFVAVGESALSGPLKAADLE